MVKKSLKNQGLFYFVCPTPSYKIHAGEATIDGGYDPWYNPSENGHNQDVNMNTIDELKQKLSELEKEIEETKKRLPAHSVKPPVMMDLLELEDEYAKVSGQIEQLKERELQNGKPSQ